MQCLQWHNCLSILPFPVIRRISQGQPKVTMDPQKWPHTHTHMTLMTLMTLMTVWCIANGDAFLSVKFSFQTVLTFLSCIVACLLSLPSPLSAAFVAHPIVDHAAMLRVKRGSSHLGEGDLNWCPFCIDFDGQANPGSWNLSWINVAQIWGVDSISRIESLQLFRQRGFWNNQLAKLQRCGSRISLGLK